MFERYVAEKIKFEKETADEIEVFTKESVLTSNLSEFTKSYIIRNANQAKIAEDVYAQIERAVKLRFNYAIRPKWTLISFLFNKYESRPPQEIISRLSVFPFYKFYKDAITNHIQDNSLLVITDSQISAVIDDTNSLIYSKLVTGISNVKIKNFFLQLFRLKYEYDHEINLDSSIPFLYIKIFLEDKSFDDLLKKFDVLKNVKDDTEVYLKDIIKVLTGKYSVSKKISDDPKTLPIELKITPSKETGNPAKELKKETREKINIDLEKPLKKKEDFIEEIKREEKIEVKDEDIYSKELLKSTEEESSLPKKSSPMVKGNEDFKIETISESSLEEKEQFNTIKNLFTKLELQNILAKVYSSSKIFRHKSFNELEKMRSWLEAKEHLKSIFNKYGVDIYDKDVVLFVDILNDHFNKLEAEVPKDLR